MPWPIHHLSNYVLVLFSATTLLVEQCDIPPLEDYGPGWDIATPMKGAVNCDYGSIDCNPCVGDLINKIGSIDTQEGSSSVHRFKGEGLGISMNLFKHPQGIARLAGIGDENWLVMPRNHASDPSKAGVVSVLFESILSDGSSWIEAPLERATTGKMSHFYSTEDNKHPGGCQIIGHTLAVAHEAVQDTLLSPTWISFYDVSDPIHIREVNRFNFRGMDSYGTPFFMSDNGQAMCVGLTRLADGRYLMLALESRRRLSSDIGWFFVSTGKDLSTTSWQFLQMWHQDMLLPGKHAFRTYENINLVTDCRNGQIYMLGFFGNGKNNAIDVFKIGHLDQGLIYLEKVFEKEVKTRTGGASFRAGGSLHVTPEGRPVIYAVEKVDRGKWLTIEEFD